MNTTYLGIDFGDKRVGVAVSDWSKDIAFPRGFLEYQNLDHLLRQIQGLCLEEGVSRIILGLPRHMSGQMGERAHKTQLFGDQLERHLPEIEVVYFDERLSTKYATEILRQQGIPLKEQKGKRDALAAQIILQNYLNSPQAER